MNLSNLLEDQVPDDRWIVPAPDVQVTCSDLNSMMGCPYCNSSKGFRGEIIINRLKEWWPNTWGPFHLYGLTLIPSWIGNYIHYIVWSEITYPFPNCNGGTVEVWEWINDFNPYFTCDYLSMLGLKLIHVSKEVPASLIKIRCKYKNATTDSQIKIVTLLWPQSKQSAINTLMPEENGWYFADDIFKYNFFYQSLCILIKMSLKFILEIISHHCLR